jgi:hypothetical protein
MLPPAESAGRSSKPVNPFVQRPKESVPETPSQYRAKRDRACNNQDEFGHGVRHVTDRANKKREADEETHHGATPNANDCVLALWRGHRSSV